MKLGTTWLHKIHMGIIQNIYSREANIFTATDCASNSLLCEDHSLRCDYYLITLVEF